MAGNKNLAAAKANKKDEFYTQRVDIENEFSHYKPHFAGKVVYCNCDDPYESWFFKYFALRLDKRLGVEYADHQSGESAHHPESSCHI